MRNPVLCFQVLKPEFEILSYIRENKTNKIEKLQTSKNNPKYF